MTSRPSTSSGVTQSTNSSHATITRPLTQSTSDVPTASVMSDEWGAPNSFGLQRRKSKSSKGGSSQADKEGAKNDVQFSTVDRTILEELRQKIRARESQFVIRSGKKHHSLSVAEAPYPRSYEREVVDHDVWNTLWLQQLFGSVTMHVFETVPVRILDVGCGTGTWILDAARQWKNSHFVGLDIVPLHPDLLQVGSADLASRITWVQANFLDGLPFSNDEFDMVRVAWIARAVPEDKWDALFEELVRIMKPGAAFELLEEDLYFPGKPRDLPSPKSSSRFTSPVSGPSSPLVRPRAPTPSSSYQSSDKSSMENLSVTSKSSLPSRDNYTPSPLVTSDAAPGTYGPQRFHAFSRPPLNPHNHSVLEHIYNEMHAARFINLQPISLLSNLINIYLKDVRTHQPFIAMFPPHPTAGHYSTIVPKSPEGSNYRSSTDSFSDAAKAALEKAVSSDSCALVDDVLSNSGSSESNEPTHWVEGHHLRFDMDDYVKLDNSRVPFVLKRRRATGASLAAGVLHAEPPADVLHDAASGQSSGSSGEERRGQGIRLSDLPNETVHFDPRTLNLHLSRKVRDVLACAEAMWDYVVDWQTQQVVQETVRGPRASHSADPWQSRGRLTATQAAAPGPGGVDPIDAALVQMTRSDFEDLLVRFEL
ncbi:hypothetical protein B0H21DRAFT_31146 [Amylocystis lapponica]|nr:hypothetical protein B0H21DRAFT_31146 [Amylocystis lapponica]